MADRVEFHLFGRPCALVGGRPIPLTSKVAQILAVLALDDRRAMARPDLAALLWDGAPDPSGNLRQLLHRLHRDWPDLAAALGADARTLRLAEGTAGFYLDLYGHYCRTPA